MTPQQTKIIELLQTGEGYTVVDFLRYGCGTEARKRVSELRREGYAISGKWEKLGNRKWKRYFLGANE